MSPERIEIESTLRQKYASKLDAEGFLPVTDFADGELHGQSKVVARLLDGFAGTKSEDNLGMGLRVIGNSGNYDTMKIHIDDLAEFLKRVREHIEKNRI
jgi:hypothetical protein